MKQELAFISGGVYIGKERSREYESQAWMNSRRDLGVLVRGEVQSDGGGGGGVR